MISHFLGKRRRTIGEPDWFNWRCEILLTRNQEAIKNKNILDLASHVGALTYGCLKLGAKHVTGVEGKCPYPAS